MTEGGEEPPCWLGEDHPRSVISNKDVEEIIDLLLYSKLTQVEIAQQFQQNTQLITSINNGVTHRQENLTYPLRKFSPYHLTNKDVNDIQWLLLNTQFLIKQIAEYYEVSEGAIKHINAGRNHLNLALSYPLRKGRAKGEEEPVSTILAKRSTTIIDT